MRLLTGLLLLVCVTVLVTICDRSFAAERRVALIIGNSAYNHVGKLPNPASDARAIAELLKRSGFDVVESRQDLNVNEMRRVVRDFTDKTRDADIAVVFYAGHGIEVDGTNYLLPVDAALERDIDVEDEAVPLDRILKIMEPVRRLRLVILDACRDNPFAKTMKRTVASRSIGRGLAKVEITASDTLIAFAAKAGSTASDGNGKNSPFTLALLNNIATPGLDLRLALGKVRDDVLKATSNKQEPFVYGSLGGTTVALIPAKAEPAVAAPAAPVDTQAGARRDYELASQIGTKEAWDQFLSVYQTGFYAGLARAARAKLAAAEARTAAKADADNKAGETKPTTTTVASLPSTPAVEAPKAAAPPPETARNLQTELRRVGCYPGDINGEWNTESRRALELFNRHARMRLDAKVASLDALDVVRGKATRVCPLQCDRGLKAQGESCVKIACPAGQLLGDDNTCQPIKEKARSAARPATRKEVEGKPAAKPTSSGSIVCTHRGCQEAVKGTCTYEVNTGGGRYICH
jgi:uncharacterized caspase-like protein